MERIIKENRNKIKNGILFTLLSLWIAIPVFQSFIKVYRYIHINKFQLELMKVMGIVGIVYGIYFVFQKIKKAENKKDAIKELLPIFIFVLYLLWTLVSCFFSPDKRLAFKGTDYRKEGYYMYLNYAGFFLCAFFLDSKKLRKILLNLFIIVTIFLIAISWIGESNPDYNRKIFVNNELDHSVFAQFNHYGYFLMMTLMCCLGLFITEKNKILKVLYALSYAFIAYSLIYNNTFGCYLAVCVSLLLYAIYSFIKKKNRMETLIAIAIFVMLSCVVTKNGINMAYKNLSGFGNDIKSIVNKFVNINTEDEEKKTEIDKEFEKAGTSRMQLWKYGIKFATERPILGYGPENLRKKYFNADIVQDRPHNLLIQLVTTSGIPGLVLYVAAVGIIVVRGIKRLLKTNGDDQLFLIVVVTYLISAMFGNSMYYTSPYFFIFLGFLM